METYFQIYEDQFWEVWKKFEVEHGNEETVREMLRVKRSVRATYNTSVNIMSAQMLATSGDIGLITEREFYCSIINQDIKICQKNFFS